MSDYGPAESTPQAELERRIMNSNLPKNEQEWWANHEICKLRERIAEIEAALEAVAPMMRNATLEEAAKAAERVQLPEWDNWGTVAMKFFGFGKRNAAAAIRALATQKPAASFSASDGLGSRE